jgi:hypothetical protein
MNIRNGSLDCEETGRYLRTITTVSYTSSEETWENEDAAPQRVADMLTELVTLESREGSASGQVQANEVLLYRGLRIRMGLHAGTVGSNARLGAWPFTNLAFVSCVKQETNIMMSMPPPHVQIWQMA